MPVCIFICVSLTRHVILSENSFLHVGDCKMHNMVGGRHMYLQQPFLHHMHRAICMPHIHVLGSGQP
jgi:hypothetical protein